MEALDELVDRLCADGRVPGAVALIGTPDGRREVGFGGTRTVGGAPMSQPRPEFTNATHCDRRQLW